MTQISHPHTGQPTASEAQWRQMGRLFTGTGVVDDVADQLEPSADGTSLETTVAAGRCFVDGFLLDSSEPVKLAHEAAHPTQDRVDLVVARYDPDFSAEGDGRVRLAVHTGVAGDGVPDPTQDPHGVWELVLAEVTVRGGAGTVVEGDVVDRRTMIGSVRDRAGTTAERDAYVAEIGDWWWNSDAVQLERWDGVLWRRAVPPVQLVLDMGADFKSSNHPQNFSEQITTKVVYHSTTTSFFQAVFVAPAAGSLRRIACSDARVMAGGTIRLDVFINATASGFALVRTAGNQPGEAIAAPDLYPFDAGDLIDIRVTRVGATTGGGANNWTIPAELMVEMEAF